VGAARARAGSDRHPARVLAPTIRCRLTRRTGVVHAVDRTLDWTHPAAKEISWLAETSHHAS
jgi:hypothetical protein